MDTEVTETVFFIKCRVFSQNAVIFAFLQERFVLNQHT